MFHPFILQCVTLYSQKFQSNGVPEVVITWCTVLNGLHTRNKSWIDSQIFQNLAHLSRAPAAIFFTSQFLCLRAYMSHLALFPCCRYGFTAAFLSWSVLSARPNRWVYLGSTVFCFFFASFELMTLLDLLDVVFICCLPSPCLRSSTSAFLCFFKRPWLSPINQSALKHLSAKMLLMRYNYLVSCCCARSCHYSYFWKHSWFTV